MATVSLNKKITEKCITLNEPEAWQKALRGIPHAFAHTWENCHAMHFATGYETYLYSFEMDEIRVVCPISERPFGRYIDIVTPYGFSGFSGNKPLSHLSELFSRFARERGYVCGYFGLNPLLQNEGYCQCDNISSHNTIYALDLRLGEGELYSRLSKNRKRQVKAARKMENFVTDKEVLLEFLLDNYSDFYREKGASSIYQFSPETFIELAKSDNVILGGTEDENGVNSVIMFAHTPYIAEYVLNVSLPEGQRNSVALLWYGIRKMIERNVRWLNLGGGIKPGDGVAQFKERFGGEEFPLFGLKQIYDEDLYRSLCDKVNADPNDSTGYFPAYRAKKSTN